jgi:hypothetical protein
MTEAKYHGANEFLPKPVTKESLRQMIEKLKI